MCGGASEDYVIGVDGLPLGTGAAAARRGEIAATFTVMVDGRPYRPLDQRVQEAVEAARSELGRPPVEVRLICVDDGTDGSSVAALSEWLDEQRVALQVLDLVRDSAVDASSARDGAAQSLERAIEAALWS